MSLAVRMLDVFLNYACQAKCPFCYNPKLTPELVRWRLPLQALAGRLLEGFQQGFRGVTFSGGEVTLLRDLPRILRLARRAGFGEIGIISNGLRLSETDYARELSEAGLSFCCLSVHGDSPRLHDRMVALPGAFVKVLAALENLRGLGLGIVLNFVLTAENFRSAPDFVERFAGLPGVLEIQLYFPHYDGLMALHADALKLRISEAEPVLREAFARARSLGAEERLWVYNASPCALPGLSSRLRNWEREEESLLVDPQGMSGGAFLSERRERTKNGSCSRCSLDERCLGFERGYVDHFGASEMRPVS